MFTIGSEHDGQVKGSKTPGAGQIALKSYTALGMLLIISQRSQVLEVMYCKPLT